MNKLYKITINFMYKERTSGIKLKTYHYIILAFLLTMAGCSGADKMQISQSPVIEEDWITFVTEMALPPMPLSNIEDKNINLHTITDDINNYSFNDIDIQLLQWSLQRKDTKAIEARMQEVDTLYKIMDLYNTTIKENAND